MVLREVWQVIMSAAFDSDQRDLVRIYFLQPLTIPQRYQPVARAMQDIGMAIDMPYPSVGAQMIAQYISYRQYRHQTLRHFQETVIWRIQYQVPWLIVRCNFGCKTASHTSSINNDMMFRNLFGERFINE